MTNNIAEDRIVENTEAITELQSAIMSLAGNRETNFDKFYKIAQLFLPFLIVWLVYYVNAELVPVRITIAQAQTKLTKNESSIDQIKLRLNSYDVREARRDAILEQMQKDLVEISVILKENRR